MTIRTVNYDTCNPTVLVSSPRRQAIIAITINLQNRQARQRKARPAAIYLHAAPNIAVGYPSYLDKDSAVATKQMYKVHHQWLGRQIMID